MTGNPSTDLWYMATPYSKFYFGLEAAAQQAARIAGTLIKQGENIFCPIVHSHVIAMHNGMDPLDHEMWMEIDKAFMERCTGLIVVMMQGWTRSKGVTMEIAAFKKMGKRIRYYNPETGVFTSEVLN